MEYKNFLGWSFTVLLIFIAEITFSNAISIFGAYPNLLLLGTIFFAIQRGPLIGELTGFVCGLLADIASISIFGSQTFMFILVGYIAGRLRGKINEEKPSAQMALVFSMSLAYMVGLYFLESLFGGSAQRFKEVGSVIQPIYSTLVAPAFFLILFWFDSIFHRASHY